MPTTTVRPAVFVGQPKEWDRGSPDDLLRWENELAADLKITLPGPQALQKSSDPNETISGSGDGWDDAEIVAASKAVGITGIPVPTGTLDGEFIVGRVGPHRMARNRLG